MIRFLKILISTLLVIARCYVIYQVIKGLTLSKQYPDYPLMDLQWYVYALILDLYIVKMIDNSNSQDIYSKKE